MTSSPTFQTLCCELVEDYYGDFYRTIFECLVFGGRFAAPQVAQKCHLPLRQAKAGLAGLIQLKLVHYHSPRGAATVYSANLTNAYNIIRTGKLVGAARQCYGGTAALVVAMACELGYATVSEIRDRVLMDEDVAESENATTIEQLIDDLIQAHYLVNLRKAHFSEAHDVKREVEMSLLSPAAISKLTGSKAKQEHAYNVERGYDGMVNTANTEYGHVDEGFTQKRNSKRNGTMNGITANGHAAPRTTLLQPNYHKIVQLSQGMIVKDLAQKMHGKRAAAILDCVLRQTADTDVWSKLQPIQEFNLDLNTLRRDINAERNKNITENGAQPNGRTNGHVYTEENEDLSIGDIDRELMFLTESSFKFLAGTPNNWNVHKGAFDEWVRKEETLRVMHSRLEPPTPRILHILIDKGKLEEKTLQEIGLLGAKELRQSLSILKQMGYLDLQEVPRNPTRQPNQTVFLWSHEAERVANLVLENVYKGIVRLLQLLKLERQKIGSTLTKIEREDVKGNEKEMLPQGEYMVLERYRRMEGWVWGEIHRLDATVAILKDT